MLNQKDVDEFRQIYAEEFGEELSVEEATEIAGRVLRLYRVLAQPLPSEIAARQVAMGEEGPRILYRHEEGEDFGRTTGR